MDFAQFDMTPLAEAEAGDLRRLIVRLRNKNMPISQSERDFLADYLEGAPKKRGPKMKLTRTDIEVWEAMEHLCKTIQMKRDAAENYVAKWVGESERNVRKRVKKVRENAAYHAVKEYQRQFDQVMPQVGSFHINPDGTSELRPPANLPRLLFRNGFTEK